MGEYWGYIITAIGTIIVAILGNKALNKKTKVEAQSSNYKVLVDSLMIQVGILNEELKLVKKELQAANKKLLENEATIIELQTHVNDQFNHIEILEAYYENMPGPAWMKDPTGMMFFINSAYANIWNVSKNQYEGHTDFDIWPKEIAKIFKQNDDLVKRKRKGIKFIETVPVDPEDPSKGSQEWHVWKFPIFIKGQLTALGGVALDVDNLSIKQFNDNDEDKDEN